MKETSEINKKLSKELSGKALLSYILLALPLAFIGLPIYINIPNYYAENFNLSLTTIGIILLFTRISDTIIDPIFGWLSDIFSQYQPLIIVVATFLLAFAAFGLFNPFFSDYQTNLLVFSFLTYWSFSFLTINHSAYLANFNNQINISSWRELMTIIGLLLATIIPALLMLKMSSREAFYYLSWLLFFTFVVMAIYFYYYNRCDSCNKAKSQEISLNLWFAENRGNLFGKIKTEILVKISKIRNRTWYNYAGFLFFNGCAIATPSTLLVFYINDFLRFKDFTGLFLLLYFGCAIAFMPIWQKLALRISSINLMSIGIIGAIATFSWAVLLPETKLYNQDIATNYFGFYGFAVICAFSGIFFGLDLLLPPVITANLIAQNQQESSKILIFSLSHFLGKISLAIVSGILLIILGKLNYSQFATVMPYLYGFLPSIFKVFGLFFLLKLKK